MRFTDAGGGLIDTYQGVTDLDYETDPSVSTIASDLDNTINSNGFYGVIGTHYDTSGSNYYQQLIDAAVSRNIPLISADQLVTWKDALNSSTFANVSSSASRLTFDVRVAEGGEGMQAMIPMSSGNGRLASLALGGSPAGYTTNTIKGIEYAVFDAVPGSYVADYGSTSVPASASGSSPFEVKSTRKTPSEQAQATVASPSPFNKATASGSAQRRLDVPVPVPHSTIWRLAGAIAGITGTLLVLVWGFRMFKRPV
jgi:hypothetical protein